ncbi:MAG: sulfite exporter TauE/SafE family protein [candidate division Zixibacteria bacterium]|nr:sulfite exporter TauE/SafE family protein [candidate division Zixibacteria bacterium]
MAILLIIVGLAAGILSGILGIGGGLLIVPALVFLCGLSQKQAQGTSLAILLLPIGILAVIEYYRAGNIDLKMAGLVALGFVFGAYGGALIANHVSDDILKRVFAVFLVLIAAKMFFGK